MVHGCVLRQGWIKTSCLKKDGAHAQRIMFRVGSSFLSLGTCSKHGSMNFGLGVLTTYHIFWLTWVSSKKFSSTKRHVAALIMNLRLSAAQRHNVTLSANSIIFIKHVYCQSLLPPSLYPRGQDCENWSRACRGGISGMSRCVKKCWFDLRARPSFLSSALL